MADEPEDDTKRKFREALERKKAKAAEGSVPQGRWSEEQKAQGHGPVESSREMRRKSGSRPARSDVNRRRDWIAGLLRQYRGQTDAGQDRDGDGETDPGCAQPLRGRPIPP